MEFKDYYEILGLKKSATNAEIKSAYKKLAKKHHPDSSSGHEEKFKEISEAYEVLKDKDKKTKYDSMRKMKTSFGDFSDAYGFQQQRGGRNRPRPGSAFNAGFGSAGAAGAGNESSFSDFFEMLFGHYAEQNPTAQQGRTQAKSKTKTAAKGENFEMEIQLSIEDAYHGTVRKIEISGSGKKTRRLEVTIPKGVKEGTKIKVANEGKPGINGGKNGDLFLVVKLKKHPLWTVEKDDIHSDLKILPHEALLGTTKEVLTIDAKVDLTIPAHTQNGKVLRLKAKGMKKAKSNSHGDHYVHIIVEIPEKPSKKELELYKEISEIHKKD